MLLEGLDLQNARAVLEYGPGTGSVTDHIRKAISPRTRLAAIEVNPRMASLFRKRHPDVTLFEDTVANARRICDYAGMDLVDCDGTSEIGTGRGYIAFRSGGVELKRVSYGAFTDPTSKYYDPTVHYHDNSANHLKPIDITELGIRNFDEVWVNMGWSTAMDNVFFSNDISVIIPEPASMVLLALPLIFSIRRRKIS